MSKAIVGDSAPSYAIQPPLDGTFAYADALRHGRAQNDLQSWRPGLRNADDDHRPDFQTNKARARELSWQDPYGANALRLQRDNIIGKSYALSLDIAARALGLDEDKAHEWERLAQEEWRRYAEGPWFGADAGRKSTFTFLMHQVLAGLHVEGEALGLIAAKPGWEGYYTCLHLIEPERLTDPGKVVDPANTGVEVINGIERDRMAEPLAYYIRKTYPATRAAVQLFRDNTMNYERVPRLTEWGRPIVLHLYDEHRPAMSRGVGSMVSVMKQMKVLGAYSDTELERAVMQASFAAVIESELDYDEAMALIGAEGQGWGNNLTAAAMQHMKMVAPYHQAIGLRYNGSRISHLLPGEKLKVVNTAIPGAEYDKFEKAILRQLAAGLGVAYESLSRDFSGTSYSAARMSLADIWRSNLVRREMINSKFAMQFVGAWMEEAILSGFLPMPDGSDPTLENWISKRHWLVRGTFVSWGKPIIDPVKERQGVQMALAMGLTTQEEEAASEGKAWDDILRQRRQEADERKRLGLNYQGVDPTLVYPGVAAPQSTAREPGDQASGGGAE